MIAKQERHNLEQEVFASRASAGMDATRRWLYMRRDEVNTKWMDASGDELAQMQGEAKLLARLIKLIEHGPVISKSTEA